MGSVKKLTISRVYLPVLKKTNLNCNFVIVPRLEFISKTFQPLVVVNYNKNKFIEKIQVRAKLKVSKLGNDGLGHAVSWEYPPKPQREIHVYAK